MSPTPRRSWLGAAAALGALVTLGRPAKAWVIPVEDVARFAEMVEQLRQAERLFNQLQAGVGALENAARRLTALPQSPDEFFRYFRTLKSTSNTIGYRIDTISRQYKRIFPDEAAIRNTPAKDVRELSESWDNEIYLSSLDAQRTQSSLKTIEANTRTSSELLQASNGSSSAVAQLQALVRMIEVINSDLEQLSATLATTERVNASLAASDASSLDVVVERRRRLLEGYSRPVSDSQISPDFLRAD